MSDEPKPDEATEADDQPGGKHFNTILLWIGGGLGAYFLISGVVGLLTR